MQIEDGFSGYTVSVDKFNRLLTVSTTRSEIEYLSVARGDCYSITTPNYTFNTINEHPWLFIENREPTLTMFFDSIIYSYNGGDTNHNRTLTKRLYRNPPRPTGNYETVGSNNLNFGSVRIADLFAYSWDGGETDGMDVDLTDTQNTLTSTVQAGTLVLSDVKGMVLPFGTSVLVSFKPEEIGNASISVKIFLKEEL